MGQDINTGSENSHTLEIRASAANSFFFDYILLGSDTAFIADTLPTFSTGSNGTSTSFADAPTSTSIDTESNHDGSRAGAIAGGVVGAIATLVVIGTAVCLILRVSRRRKPKNSISMAYADTNVDGERLRPIIGSEPLHNDAASASK